MFIFISFVVWKTVDLLTSLIAPHTIPFLGFFPYKELLADYKLPMFLSSFASFDGTQYLTLVREGYNTYTQAYFPLYFLLVRVVSLLFPMFQSVRTHNDLVASLLVSNASFLVGLILFKKYLALIFPKKDIVVSWTILFLLFFPTSFFFGAVYTESLFFLLFIGSLYFLEKKQYLMAGIFAALSSATRLMGVFLIVPFLFHFVNRSSLRCCKLAINNFRFQIKHLAIGAPFVGLGIYMVYLWVTVRDPLFFFNVQPVFGAKRSTSFILLPQVYYRYLKILLTAQWNFQYFVSLIEVVFFTFIFTIVILNLFQDLSKMSKQVRLDDRKIYYTGIGLGLFSLINILLPTLTGTFSSIPRYSLMSISAFIFLGKLQNNILKIMLLGVFFIFHIILLGFFIQGYFVG